MILRNQLDIKYNQLRIIYLLTSNENSFRIINRLKNNYKSTSPFLCFIYAAVQPGIFGEKKVSLPVPVLNRSIMYVKSACLCRVSRYTFFIKSC